MGDEPLGGLIGKAFRGCKSGGITLQEAVGVSQFQDAIDHTRAAREAQSASGVLEPGEAVDNFAQAAAVQLRESGEVKHDALVVCAEKVIKRQFELLALDAHL